MRVAKATRSWVGVSRDRYEMLRVLEAEDVFCADIEQCQIQVHPLHELTASRSVMHTQGTECTSTTYMYNVGDMQCINQLHALRMLIMSFALM